MGLPVWPLQRILQQPDTQIPCVRAAIPVLTVIAIDKRTLMHLICWFALSGAGDLEALSVVASDIQFVVGDANTETQESQVGRAGSSWAHLRLGAAADDGVPGHS
jgi:hypothetical protein